MLSWDVWNPAEKRPSQEFASIMGWLSYSHGRALGILRSMLYRWSWCPQQDTDNPLAPRPAAQRGAVGGELFRYPLYVLG